MGVYEEMEGMTSKVVARLSDVIDKQFSLAGNEQAIAGYLQREIERQRT
jgi:hypothetical protein